MKNTTTGKKGKGGRKSEYTEEKVRVFLDAIESGQTLANACILIGKTTSTVCEWLNKKPEFFERYKKARENWESKKREELLAAAKKSLMQLVSGYECEETQTEYVNDKDGRPIIKGHKKTIKHIAPNTAATIFALTNLEPERWKNRQSTDVTGKMETEVRGVDLSKVPDELLAKVIDSIKK